MARFAVHENPNPATRERFPLLLDVQSDLVSELATRVVVPLCPLARMEHGAMRTLTPILDFDGKEYVMLTPQLAGIPARQCGPLLADLSGQREAICAALDLLFTGI
jgi:toxin CcdB